MDNTRLNTHSEYFTHDNGSIVDKRCFFYACGEDDGNSNFFTFSTSINAFDDPKVRQKAEIDITIKNMFVELCSEMLSNITHLIPEFKALHRYKDLTPSRANLERSIELWTPIYLLKKALLTKTDEIPEEYILKEFGKLKQKAIDAIPEAVIKAKQDKQNIETFRAMKNLDQSLSRIDAAFALKIIDISLAVTGNRTQDANFSNNRLVEVGASDLKISMLKEREKLRANICGVKVGVDYTFANVFKFFLKFGEQVKRAGDEFKQQVDFEEYRKFIKEIDLVKREYKHYTEEEQKAVNEALSKKKLQNTKFLQPENQYADVGVSKKKIDFGNSHIR